MNKYHYTESGLRNVYLVNGFEIVKTPYGEAVSIHDLDGLHRVIGLNLCAKKHITGTEFRFLRKEMGMSQNGLAQTLGTEEQTLAKWEKNGRVPKTADRFMRLFYLETINQNETIKGYVEKINQTDRDVYAEIDLEQTKEGWKQAA